MKDYEERIKTLSVLYDENGNTLKRVYVRTWPRTAQNVAFPRRSTVFPVVDINTNKIYIAEYKKLNGRLDLSDLRLVCVEPRTLFPELIFKAHEEYFNAVEAGEVVGIEEMYKPVTWKAF